MRYLFPLCVALSAAGLACDSSPAMTSPAAFEVNCTVAAATDEAKVVAGPRKDGSVILPGGRRVSPAGRLLDVGGFPLALRVLPGDRYVVVTDGAYGDEALRIVDLQAKDPHKAIVSQIDYPMKTGSAKDPALFYGLALTKDGKRLYVADGGYDPVDPAVKSTEHYNLIEAFDIAGDPPQLKKNEAATIKLYFNAVGHTDGQADARLPAGLALSGNETLLYAVGQSDASLAIIDLKQGPGYGVEIGRAILPGLAPYDVVVDETSHTAFVSLWGGDKKSGKPIDGLVLVDVADPKKPLPQMDLLPTGKASEAELLVGSKLYVANADADTVSTVDLATRAVKNAATSLGTLLGSSPNNLAVDLAAGRLYVANAGENSVVALDLQTMAMKGRIPTAWYPTAVAVLGDGSLLIASAKGMGLGPTDHAPPSNNYMVGTLQVVPRPTDKELADGDQVVAANFNRPKTLEAKLTCPPTGDKRFPLRADLKSPTPIQHVFFVLRENKTYDSVFGDLKGGNGDPKLTLFGEENTPNAHALARRFVNFDNCYSQAEQSLQGHVWATGAMANDYTEKGWATTWGRATRPLSAFSLSNLERLAQPGSDTIWSHFDKAGIDYHVYGELANIGGAKHQNDPKWPGYFQGMGVLDVVKAQYLIDNINDSAFTVEPFSYVSLPNDHTYGTAPGKPTPQSMVADNDEATGRFVEALSRSKYWDSSIVFIIEDDPQTGADHVEGHRTICLAASPWVKPGYTSSIHYDIAAMIKTMELLLGVGPINRFDDSAPAMYDIFDTKPNRDPYVTIPRKIPAKVNGADAPLAEESARIDWTLPDPAPLGRILWKAMRGEDAEPPWGKAASPFRARGGGDHDGDDD